MRMPEIASQAVYDTLKSITAVTNLVGERIINLATVPQDIEYPAILHYAEPGGDGYTGSINAASLPERVNMRYVVRVLDLPGESSDAIDAAADAVIVRFSGNWLVSPAGYIVEADALEPWPQMFSYGVNEDGGVIYRQTGDFYAIDVLRTGA
jgi:hypothetical protein